MMGRGGNRHLLNLLLEAKYLISTKSAMQPQQLTEADTALLFYDELKNPLVNHEGTLHAQSP